MANSDETANLHSPCRQIFHTFPGPAQQRNVYSAVAGTQSRWSGAAPGKEWTVYIAGVGIWLRSAAAAQHQNKKGCSSGLN